MTVKILLTKQFCITAMKHALYLDSVISSIQKFTGEVKSYLTFYGESCLYDHDNELKEFEDEAQEIVDKYY